MVDKKLSFDEIKAIFEKNDIDVKNFAWGDFSKILLVHTKK